MKHSRAQTKAALLAEAEALIESLLAWQEQTPQPNMRQIEDEVLALRRQFGQRLALAVIEEQAAKQPAEAPPCPQCDQAMSYKGQKGVNIETRLGPLAVERGYYHCARCQSGLFPPE